MNYFLLDYSEEGNQTETLELMKLLENDDHIRLIGVKEKKHLSLFKSKLGQSQPLLILCATVKIKFRSSNMCLLIFCLCAASLFGGKKEVEACAGDCTGFISRCVNQIKDWLLSHSQYLNFFTILIPSTVRLDARFEELNSSCRYFSSLF